MSGIDYKQKSKKKGDLMFKWFAKLFEKKEAKSRISAKVISTCIGCGAKLTEECDDFANYKHHHPHCNWCLTPIGMDGKLRPTCGNTMEISEVQINGKSYTGDQISEAFAQVGNYRSDLRAEHQLAKAYFKTVRS